MLHNRLDAHDIRKTAKLKKKTIKHLPGFLLVGVTRIGLDSNIINIALMASAVCTRKSALKFFVNFTIRGSVRISR